MGAPLHSFTGKVGSDFGNLELVWQGNDIMATLLSFQTTADSFFHPYGYTESAWATSFAVDGHMVSLLHCFTGKVGSELVHLGLVRLKIDDAMVTSQWLQTTTD